MLQKYKVVGFKDFSEEDNLNIPIFGKFDTCSRTNDGIFSLIQIGNYIGLLPESYARQWVHNDMIKPLEIANSDILIETKIIYKPTRAEEPILKSLLKSLDIEPYPMFSKISA